MRDILITAIVFASLPFIFKSPVIGMLMWVWLSVMNPHTQAWGFAAHFPFAMIVALATLASMVFSHDAKALPLMPVTLALLAFVLWMNMTTPFALFFDDSMVQWRKVMKIMLMTVVGLMLIKTRQDVHRLIWVLVVSLGYYGVKGGIFTIKSGGQDKVWGPEGTFIDDNNAIALALIMAIPLMHYLQHHTQHRWVRHALSASMVLCALAALGSYSRGALLAIGAMGVFMWLKSSKKATLGILLIVAAPLMLMFMPDQWTSRMDSIHDYQSDSSAQGRFNAWAMAWNLARDRFFGGGFEIYDSLVFRLYAPAPEDVHAAHSIYFQALGEHGFVGLGLYVLFGVLTWRCAAWIIGHAGGIEQLAWAKALATMIQTSLIGFAVGGAFLSLLYFDVPYYLMSALVATRVLVAQHLATLQRKTSHARSTVDLDVSPRAGTARPPVPGRG